LAHTLKSSSATLAKQLEETRWTEHGEQIEGLTALIEGEHRDVCTILLKELELVIPRSLLRGSPLFPRSLRN
jgi:hypothetical protein